MKVEIRGQTCHLLAERALFWEEQKTLVFADIHIGKSTVFQQAGVPIPSGHMEDDLKALSLLIDQYKAEKCIVVGDLIHARKGLTESVRGSFSQWLQNTPCEIHLVLGNHDRSLIKGLPEEWPLHLHLESLIIEPFYFSHFPMHHKEHFVWSGHLHPKVLIKNSHDQLVLRCFQISAGLGILPAFGSFVGGTFVKKEPGSNLYAIAGSEVIKL